MEHRRACDRLSRATTIEDFAQAIEDGRALAKLGVPTCLQPRFVRQVREETLRRVQAAQRRFVATWGDELVDEKEQLSTAVRTGQLEPLRLAIQHEEALLERLEQTPAVHGQLDHPKKQLAEVKRDADRLCNALELVSEVTLSHNSGRAVHIQEQIMGIRERVVAMAWREHECKFCVICLEQRRAQGGAECTSSPAHFLCELCLGKHVWSQVGAEGGAGRRKDNAKVCCPAQDCRGTFLSQVLALKCAPEVFEALVQWRIRQAVATTEARVQAALHVQLDQEIRRLQHLNASELQVEAAVRHVQQNIFTLKCPRCSVAWLDFDGCCALTCSNYECRCHFCAWCLTDCGPDAHAHVLLCPDKPSSVGRRIFARWDQVQQVHRARQSRRLREYLLAIVDKQIRDGVRDRLQQSARDIGVDIRKI